MWLFARGAEAAKAEKAVMQEVPIIETIVQAQAAGDCVTMEVKCIDTTTTQVVKPIETIVQVRLIETIGLVAPIDWVATQAEDRQEIGEHRGAMTWLHRRSLPNRLRHRRRSDPPSTRRRGCRRHRRHHHVSALAPVLLAMLPWTPTQAATRAAAASRVCHHLQGSPRQAPSSTRRHRSSGSTSCRSRSWMLFQARRPKRSPRLRAGPAPLRLGLVPMSMVIGLQWHRLHRTTAATATGSTRPARKL